MKLDNVGMLAADTPRSAAYIQLLAKHQLLPSYVIVIISHEKKQLSPEQFAKKDSPNFSVTDYFDPSISFVEYLRKMAVSFDIAGSDNVNDKAVIELLKKRNEKFFIYSGLGGQILKDEILSFGKKILHFHSGRVPDYRGSTTVYYSILNEDRCYVSAFFLDRKIDTGPLVRIKDYPKPADGRIIDTVYDPFIRAELLVEIIQEYVKSGIITTQPQPKEKEETYFIIHPVLKHIAILSCSS